MKNTKTITIISLTIFAFLIGIWPLGIIGIIYIIVTLKKKKKNEREAEKNVYKTAAEIEHQLNENRYKEETKDKP